MLVSNNSTGFRFQNSAINTGVLNDVQLVNNGTGMVALGTSSTGPATVTIQNGVVVNNGTVGIVSGGFSAVMVGNSTIANNGIGLEAQSIGAVLRASESAVTGNATGWLAVNGGQVISSGNNGIGGNVTGNAAPPIALVSTTPTSTPTPTTNYLLNNAGIPLVDSSGALLTAS